MTCQTLVCSFCFGSQKSLHLLTKQESPYINTIKFTASSYELYWFNKAYIKGKKKVWKIAISLGRNLDLNYYWTPDVVRSVNAKVYFLLLLLFRKVITE